MNLLHNEMTIVQCRNPILLEEIYRIMVNSHGYKRYSWNTYTTELLEKILPHPLFHTHVVENDNVASPISQQALTALLEDGASATILSQPETNNTTSARILSVLQTNANIKYTKSYEFEEPLARTLCFALSAINDKCNNRKLLYHELYNCILTGLRKSGVSLSNFVLNYIISLGNTTPDNDTIITGAFKTALNDGTYNNILSKTVVSGTSNFENFTLYLKNVLFPCITSHFDNAFAHAFDNGVLASSSNKNIENILFESNNDDVLIEGEYGDYRLFGRVIRVVNEEDYNAEYNVMRWQDNPQNNERNYIYDGKIDQYIRSNADRYTRNTFERMRKRLLKVYHNRYTDDELREILFPRADPNTPNVLSSGKKDFFIPLKYTNEKYGCTKFHIDCDATECPDTEHTHTGSVDCTRCKYMKIRYGELNVYILVNIGTHSVDPVNDALHTNNLKNGIRDIIMYAE